MASLTRRNHVWVKAFPWMLECRIATLEGFCRAVTTLRHRSAFVWLPPNPRHQGRMMCCGCRPWLSSHICRWFWGIRDSPDLDRPMTTRENICKKIILEFAGLLFTFPQRKISSLPLGGPYCHAARPSANNIVESVNIRGVIHV